MELPCLPPKPPFDRTQGKVKTGRVSLISPERSLIEIARTYSSLLLIEMKPMLFGVSEGGVLAGTKPYPVAYNFDILVFVHRPRGWYTIATLRGI